MVVFYDTLNLDDQLRKGMLPNQDTIQWWMKQDDEARKVFSELKIVDDAVNQYNYFKALVKKYNITFNE